jgi:hypothetical protein
MSVHERAGRADPPPRGSRSDAGEDLLHCSPQVLEIALRDLQDLFEVDAVVLVDQLIAHSRDFTPKDLRDSRARFYETSLTASPITASW